MESSKLVEVVEQCPCDDKVQSAEFASQAFSCQELSGYFSDEVEGGGVA